MLSWGRNGCIRHAWLQATWSQREVLHTRVQIDTTIMNLLPAEMKNSLIKNQNKCKSFEIPFRVAPRHKLSLHTSRIQ